MEQERPRAAGRIHDPLFQRVVHGGRDHAGGEPVGGVVFPEAVAGLGGDQVLVERLEDVHPNIAQAEPVHLPRDPHDQFRAVLGGQRPVEEIWLALAGNAEVRERRAVEQRGRVRGGASTIAATHRLGDDGEIGMLQEQRVVADLGPVGEAQEPVPQIAFQARSGHMSDAVPEIAQAVEGAPRGQAPRPSSRSIICGSGKRSSPMATAPRSQASSSREASAFAR